MYRPPDSRIEFNDRFEGFMDNVFKDDKETILLTSYIDREWLNVTLTLGLTQLFSNPTRVTYSTSTLIYFNIYIIN